MSGKNVIPDGRLSSLQKRIAHYEDQLADISKPLSEGVSFQHPFAHSVVVRPLLALTPSFPFGFLRKLPISSQRLPTMASYNITRLSYGLKPWIYPVYYKLGVLLYFRSLQRHPFPGLSLPRVPYYAVFRLPIL